MITVYKEVIKVFKNVSKTIFYQKQNLGFWTQFDTYSHSKVLFSPTTFKKNFRNMYQSVFKTPDSVFDKK